MSGVNDVSNTSSTSATTLCAIPAGSIQLAYAALQLTQAELCKDNANAYMEAIEKSQADQQECAEMIAAARELQEQAGEDGATYMTDEMVAYFDAHGLSYDTTGGEGDYLHDNDEWEYNITSLTNYQETLGTETQTNMVYLQDYLSQYNSYLQGASSAIDDSNQTLSTILNR